MRYRLPTPFLSQMRYRLPTPFLSLTVPYTAANVENRPASAKRLEGLHAPLGHHLTGAPSVPIPRLSSDCARIQGDSATSIFSNLAPRHRKQIPFSTCSHCGK